MEIPHAQRIARWRDNVIDLDTAVDDTRRELDAVLERLCQLLSARTAARRELARLIRMARAA